MFTTELPGVWWVQSPLIKINTHTPAPPPEVLQREATISLARNEYEGFQIALRFSEETPDIHVDFANAPDAIEWQWFLVGYTLAGKMRQPDMLLPVDRAIAPADVNCILYIQARAPVDAKAGEHRGNLTIKRGDEPIATVPVTATIHEFELPEGPANCKTSFALQEARKQWAPGEFRKYADLMLDYRVNPDDIYRLKPPRIEDLEHYYKRGMNCFTVRKVARNWDLKPLLTFFENLKQSPNGQAIRDCAIVYGYDEKGKEHWPAMRDCFEELARKLPDIERVTTAHVYMDWTDPVTVYRKHYIDVVAPWMHPGYRDFYSLADREKLAAAGYELWCYNINFQTHYPLIQPRVLWWMMYQQKVDGWPYYCVNGWAKDSKPHVIIGSPLIDYAPRANGQGELIYQGIDGPIGSLRMANIRDGIEDYEYLVLLAKREGDIDKARGAAEPVAWGPLKWTDDPQVLLDARAAIAKRIVNAK